MASSAETAGNSAGQIDRNMEECKLLYPVAQLQSQQQRGQPKHEERRLCENPVSS